MRKPSWGLVIVLAACAHAQAERGGERGACLEQRRCNAGLLCLSDTCVRPPADCKAVATHLVDLKVGTSADEIAGACVDRNLDAAARECVAGAPSAAEAARCPGAASEGGAAFWSAPTCHDVAAHVITLLGEKDRSLSHLAEMTKYCESEHLSAEKLRCYNAAKAIDDLGGCERARPEKERARAHEPPPQPPVDDGSPVGVAECDLYIEKMRACARQMIREAQEPMEESMTTMKQAWRDAASTPEGRQALASGCAQAFAAAKSAYASMGCSFDDDEKPVAPAKKPPGKKK
jgi:hypothetical protein